MSINNLVDFCSVFTQKISAEWLTTNTQLSVLRLDQLHPIVSGNKWFKLQFYLKQILNNANPVVATFGGAYSNHIVATAFACSQLQIPCVGFIRGEQAPALSHTLQHARNYGMQLRFVTREAYRHPATLMEQHPDYYWIPEGGYGLPGAEGAASILSLAPQADQYSHILAATGTGTMLAGLIKAAHPGQRVTGISVMKGNYALHQAVQALLPSTDTTPFNIEHDFHFGGYAKHPPQLIQYIIRCWQQFRLPLDIVYTAKAFYATEQLIQQHTIPPGSNVLFIHSGGLQGNLSLPEGTFPFS